MFQKYCLVTFLLLIKIAQSIKSSDFCNRVDKDCKGFYDSQEIYHIKCDYAKCQGIYKYSCGDGRCALDKSVCEKFQVWSSSLNSVISSRRVTDQIKNCSSLPFKLHLENVCINGANCFQKKLIHVRTGGVKLFNKIDCPCPISHGYHCGHKICTKSKKTCENFLSSHNKRKIPKSLKSCGNSNIILRKIYSLF